MSNNPAGCFNNTRAAWGWAAEQIGVDISGKGRSFTSVSGVTPGTLTGVSAPAGIFASSSYARLTNPSFLSLTDLTVEFFILPTAMTTSAIVFRAGSLTSLSDFGCIIRLLQSGTNFFWSCLKRGNLPGETGSTVQEISDGGSAITLSPNLPYHVAVVFASGVSNKIYVNGANQSLTHSYLRNNANGTTTPITGGPLSGAIPILSTYELSIGDPALTTRVGFAGTLSRVVVYPYPFLEPQPAASYRMQVDGPLFPGFSGLAYNIGAQVAAGAANHGPVAVPHRVGSVVAGNLIDIDVAARGFDADGNTKTALLPADIPFIPNLGTRSITGGLLRYTPNAGTGGSTHTIPQRIRDAAIESLGIVRVLVNEPTTGRPYSLPVDPDTERNSLFPSSSTTYYVRPGGSGIGGTTEASAGSLSATLSGVNDGSIVVALPGNYGDLGTRPNSPLLPKSGEEGRLLILAKNPVFTDLDLTGKGAMVGYDKDAAHSVIIGHWEVRFQNLWIEGFRLGQSPDPTWGAYGTQTSCIVTMHDIAANKRNWFVKNYLKNTIQNGFVVETAQNTSGTTGGVFAYRNYCMCDSFDQVPADDANWANDYFMFVDDGHGAGLYYVENIFRGGYNQALSFKLQASSGFVHGNIWNRTETSRGGGTALYLGQTSDKTTGNDNTVGSILASYNRFFLGAGGMGVHFGNVQDATVEYNTFSVESSTCDLARFLTATVNAATVRGPRNPRTWIFRNNTFLNPARSQILFGRTRVDESKQTSITIENNISSETIPSEFSATTDQGQFPDSNNPSFPDFDFNARLRVRLGTNARVSQPPGNNPDTDIQFV